MSEWTICITPMPTEEALDIAARIADAEWAAIRTILLTALVITLLVCGVGVWLSSRIARPLAFLDASMQRVRGLHLDEAHVRVDGAPLTGALFDFGLFLFHNAREQLRRGGVWAPAVRFARLTVAGA